MRVTLKKITCLILSFLLLFSLLPGATVLLPPSYADPGETTVWFSGELLKKRTESMDATYFNAKPQKLALTLFPVVAEAKAAGAPLTISEPDHLTAAHVLVAYFRSQSKNPYEEIQWNEDGSIKSIQKNEISPRYIAGSGMRRMVEPLLFLISDPYQQAFNPFDLAVAEGQWIRMESMKYTPLQSGDEPEDFYRMARFAQMELTVAAEQEIVLPPLLFVGPNGQSISLEKARGNSLTKPPQLYYYTTYRYDKIKDGKTWDRINVNQPANPWPIRASCEGDHTNGVIYKMTFLKEGDYLIEDRNMVVASGSPKAYLLIHVTDAISPLGEATAKAKKILDKKEDYWQKEDRHQYQEENGAVATVSSQQGFFLDLEEEYKTAVLLNAAAQSSEEEKNQEAQKLEKASSLVIPKTQANITLLLEEVQKSQDIFRTPEYQNYAPATRVVFEEALEKAAQLLEAMKKALPILYERQGDTDQHQKALQSARANLTTGEAAQGMRGELESVVEEALRLKEEDYTPESWAIFHPALLKAQNLLKEESPFGAHLQEALARLKEAYYHRLVDADGKVQITLEVDNFELFKGKEVKGGSYLNENLEVSFETVLPSKYFEDKINGGGYTGFDRDVAKTPTAGAAIAKMWADQGMVPDLGKNLSGVTYFETYLQSVVVQGTGSHHNRLDYSDDPAKVEMLAKILYDQDPQTLERLGIDRKDFNYAKLLEHFAWLKEKGYGREQLAKAPITGGTLDSLLGGQLNEYKGVYANTSLYLNGRFIAQQITYDTLKIVLHQGDTVTLSRQAQEDHTFSRFEQKSMTAEVGQEVVFQVKSFTPLAGKAPEQKNLEGAALWLSQPYKTSRDYYQSGQVLGTTDSQGTLRYRFVRPGQYLVVARSLDYKGFAPSFCRVTVTGDESPQDAAVEAILQGIARRFGRVDPGELSDWWQIGMGLYGRRTITQEQKDTFARRSVGALRSVHGPAMGQPAVWTDYARIGIALGAVGYDVSNLGAYGLGLKDQYGQSVNDMITDGCNFAADYTSNGPIWMLILLDSRNYKVPEGSKWTREKLIADILEYQAGNGSFSLFEKLKGQGSASDVDMTGMALQALAPYQNQAPVKAAIDKAIHWLSNVQASGFNGFAEDDNGQRINEWRGGDFMAAAMYGPGSYRNLNPTSESTSQVAIALTALGIDPQRDPRFTKRPESSGESFTVISGLQKYVIPSGDGLAHVAVQDVARNTAAYYFNGMATEQGFLAFQSYQKFLENGRQSTRLYFFGDAAPEESDKSALESAIKAAQKVDLSPYKELGASRFRWSLSKAKETLANPYASQERVNTAWITLTDSFLLLDKQVSKKDLEEMVLRIESALKDHPQQRVLRFCNINKDNRNILNAVEGAKGLLAKPELTQEEIQQQITILHQLYLKPVRSYTFEDEKLALKFANYDRVLGGPVWTEYWGQPVSDIGEENSFLAPAKPYMSRDPNRIASIAVSSGISGVNEPDFWTYGTAGGDRQNLHRANTKIRQAVAQLHYKPMARIKGEETLINPAVHLKPLIDRAQPLKAQDFTSESWSELAMALREAKVLYAGQSTTPSSLSVIGDHAGRAPPQEPVTTDSAVGVNNPALTTDSAVGVKDPALTTDSAVGVNDPTQTVPLQDNYTATQVAQACTRLMQALNHLKAQRQDLEKLLLQAGKLTQNAFKPGYWTILQESIIDARLIYENQYVTRQNILDSLEDLQGIYDEILQHPQEPDPRVLTAMVEAVEELKEVNYKKEPWQAFDQARKEGQDFLKDSRTSQQALNESLFKIANATRSLVKSRDKAALGALLEQAKAQKQIGEEDALWKVLQESIREAQKVLEDPKAWQEDINNTYSKLHNALLQYRSAHQKPDQPINPEDPDVPAGPVDPKPPAPSDPEAPVNKPEVPEGSTVLFSIDKETIGKGYVLPPTKILLKQGESMWDVFQRATSQHGIPFKHRFTPQYNSVYIEWIDGDGEFDHGSGSGWMYNVNGIYPMVGASLYYPKPDDVIQWRYTTNLGDDIGGGMGIGGAGQLRDTLKEYMEAAKAFDEKEYTKESYQRLQEALKEAQSIYDDKGADKHTVHGALKKLSDAIKAMERLSVEETRTNYRSSLQKLVDKVKALDEALYEQESFQALKSALQKAQGVLARSDATAEELKDALSKLEDAYEKLIDLHGEKAKKPDVEESPAKEDPAGLPDQNSVLRSNPKYLATLQEELPPIDLGYRYKDHKDFSSWAAQYALKARSYQLMTGDKAGYFHPKKAFTRGELAAVLANLFVQVPWEKQQNTYRDVAPDKWYSEAIEKVSALGLMVGIGQGKFAPEEILTREQLACVLQNLQNYDPGIAKEPKDLGKAGTWAKEAITRVYGSGLMTGDKEHFSPKAPVTREMAAAILVKLYEQQFEYAKAKAKEEKRQEEEAKAKEEAKRKEAEEAILKAKADEKSRQEAETAKIIAFEKAKASKTFNTPEEWEDFLRQHGQMPPKKPKEAQLRPFDTLAKEVEKTVK